MKDSIETLEKHYVAKVEYLLDRHLDATETRAIKQAFSHRRHVQDVKLKAASNNGPQADWQNDLA